MSVCSWSYHGQMTGIFPLPWYQFWQPSAHTVLGFAVAHLDTVVAALRARGVTWERFPGFPHDADGVVRTPDGSRVVWFRDPDGNLLSIVQYA